MLAALGSTCSLPSAREMCGHARSTPHSALLSVTWLVERRPALSERFPLSTASREGAIGLDRSVPSTGRMKLIVEGGSCQSSSQISGVTGLTCTGTLACDTEPTIYEMPLGETVHWWADVTVSVIGVYQVCHCDTACATASSWVDTGALHVQSPVSLRISAGNYGTPGTGAAQVASSTGLPTPQLEWRFDDAQVDSSDALDWLGSSIARGSGLGIFQLPASSEPSGHHLELLSVDFTSVWVDGMVGGALVFDGTAWGSPHARDLVSADALGLPSREVTVAAWINVHTFTEKGGVISFVQFGGEVSAGWSLFVSSSAKAHFVVATEFSSSDLFRHEANWLTSPSFSTHTWHHVVGMYDGSLARLFWDGVEASWPPKAFRKPEICRAPSGSVRLRSKESAVL